MPGTRRIPIPAGGFRRIAVLRLSSLGDVVLTLPVVHALRAAFPAAEIVYWVREEHAGVVRHDPAISRVRVLERGARRAEDLVSMSAELEEFDLILDLHGNLAARVLSFRQRGVVLRWRGERLTRERWVRARWSRPPRPSHVTARYAAALAPLGLSAEGPPRLALDVAAVQWARDWMTARSGGGAWVVYAPGARHATKCWPESRWIELDQRLAALGVNRVALTTPAERRALPALGERLAASGGAWLTEGVERAAAVASLAAVAVTHDSGIMHVAAACGRPVVALFGSTAPVLGFAPVGEGHAVLGRELPCRPCTLHGRERCPLGTLACLNGIEVAEVEAAVRERLSPR